MNVRSSAQEPDSQERKVAAVLAKVEALAAGQRHAEAQRVLDEAASLFPDHPRVLHERARRLALGGNPDAARTLLERVVLLAPKHVPFWLSLAAVLRTLNRREDESAALERALAIDPTHLVVLLQKGSLLDLSGKPRAAAAVYGHALQSLAPGTPLPAPIEAHLGHAGMRVAENAARLGALLDARLAALSPPGLARDSRRRFDRCLDRVLGRRAIYTPEPTGILFPYLSNHEFFDRERFHWVSALEAATEPICEELLGVLSADQPGMEPYIAFDPGVPLRQWGELNHSRRWSAYFLWNQGRREEAHAARCPRTMAALSQLPQVDIPGHGPTAFFSILDARTKIPAHNGVTNTRLTVHLPLIVPGSCRFRVGGEIREWRKGEAWVFDDTIEHEAWNDSDRARAILIFDVWNPELTELERDLVREMTAALAEYYDFEGSVPGVSV